MSWLERALPPSAVCSYLKVSEPYQQQRDRAAILAHKGFAYWDKYQELRPHLFIGSLLFTAAAGSMWYFRGFQRVKKGNQRIAEAHAIYPLLAALGLAAAYVTRPEGVLPSREPRITDKSGTGFTSWLDGMVEQERSKNPRFADKAIKRLVDAPAVQHMWGQVPAHAQALITCGRQW